MPDSIGHFRIVRRIGEGGMGVVYEAVDDRLGRSVAIKTVRDAMASREAREQLWREARSLASVSHPRICQLFDAVEQDDALYLVMELLDGEPLARRLASGPLPVADAATVACQVLDALEALHRIGIVHRDLKPSNVFLTPHGVKVLDFGLARTAAPRPTGAELAETAATLTTAGTIAGTPYYMSPEQVEGKPASPPSDIFAVGCILYEMLAGKRAFAGDSLVDVLYAVAHHNPPPLAGSVKVEALDHVIRRALAKRPQERYASAAEMMDAIAALPLSTSSARAVGSRTVVRLIALPFRALRKDDETDFLAYSLPDAISSSLSGADGVIVRSSLVAARFEGPVDPKRVAVEADVDAIVTGTLMRTGDRLRVACQLVEAPGGAVIWYDASVVAMDDLFQLQDELSKRIVHSLMLPLTEREHRILKHDIPANARSYEYYLRANQVAAVRTLENMGLARDLYRQCLDQDPEYAPAWARLGRVYRFLEKFDDEADENRARASEAFRKAFDLNADLPIAHNLYTQMECDQGRAVPAMLRLLDRARFRRNDAELFAGLVQACRYSDELDASVAAHVRARHLDPHTTTSVAHTYFLLGEYEKTVECYGTKGGFYLDCAAMVMLGEREAALSRLRDRERSGAATGAVRAIMKSLRAYLEGDSAACLLAIESGQALTRQDPESLLYSARHLAQIGERDRALSVLSQVLDGGFLCGSALRRDAWFAPLRTSPGYQRLIGEVDRRGSDSHTSFLEAGGPELLHLACARASAA